MLPAGQKPMVEHVPGVSVVIPAYGLCSHLTETIEALLDQICQPAEIIVVHTGTHDPSNVLSRYGDKVRVFHSNDRMLGGAARNVGLQKAQYDWVAFVDSDVVPSRVWLQELLAVVASSADRFAVGSIGYADSGGYWGICLWVVEFGIVHPYLPAGEIESGASANMMAPRAAISKLNGFPEHFQPGEDTALHAGLRGLGLSLHFCPLALVNHYNPHGFRHCVQHLYHLGFYSARVRREHRNLRGHRAVDNPFLATGLWAIRFSLISYRILRWGKGLRRWSILFAPGILLGCIAWNIGFVANLVKQNPLHKRGIVDSVSESG